MTRATNNIALIVDLDGTLVRSDLLLECALLFIRQQPLRCWQLLLWLVQGKRVLKRRLALSVTLEVAGLPYEQAVIEAIENAKKNGRCVILATASYQSLARKVAAHIGLFDGVMATDRRVNLCAERKRDALIERCGEGGYEYIGNAADDLPVWKAAYWGYAINASKSVLRRARELGNMTELTPQAEATWRDYIFALRPHQWAKNLLVFVPILAAHQFDDSALVLSAVIAFVCFSLCASSVYLINDVFDLADDRSHPTKRNRPIAAGRVSIPSAFFCASILLLLATVLALVFLPLEFAAVLFAYFACTLAYSLGLKRKVALDVIVLAALYTLRVIAGASATYLSPTFWMLAFSMFMFLSLALVKRYAELYALHLAGQAEQTPGRGYYPGDRVMIAALGGAAGYSAVMILALYIRDLDTMILYSQPQVIWLACPLLLYWITRIWILTFRGEMNQDPVIFAIKDRLSLIVAAAFGVVFWIAT